MSRTQEYTNSYRSYKVKELGVKVENVYICDIQGFQRIAENSFIFKEVSFLNLRKTALPTCYLFKPPLVFSKLTETEKCLTEWLERNHHGIAWNSGDIPYHRLRRIFEICSQGAEKIYVKGHQKMLRLRQLLPNVSNSRKTFILYQTILILL